MTQFEREDLVERYLAGEMAPDQEAEFFLHVAVDDELQRTLKAFRIMDKAISRDRESGAGERSRYREHIMAMLAASPAVVGEGAAGASSTTGGTAAAGIGAWKTAIIAIVTGGLAAATAIVVAPRIIGSDDPAPAVREVSPNDIPRMEEPGGEVKGQKSEVKRGDVPRMEEPGVNREPVGRKAVKESVPSRTERSGGARAAGARRGEEVRQETPPEATDPARRTDGDSGPYVKLPDRSSDNVTIPAEVEPPKLENE